ncbi:MAG: AMP-binding protein [Thiolinea sp.]
MAGFIPVIWIYTGDLGYADEDGYPYLVDRKKDMILSGSVNVYPRDIENVIFLPGIYLRLVCGLALV